MKIPSIASLLTLAIAVESQAAPYTEPLGPSQGNFGGVGLWQMPTGRVAQEGEFSVNLMNNYPYRFYSISLQVFPWLEATLRYTDVRTRKYSSRPEFSGDQTYKDKGIDLKLRLWRESYWLPETSIGTRDFGGTGLFDSEYIAATKAWGMFDFTLGVAWGYLGNRGNIKNPFCKVSDHYCRRNGTYGDSSLNTNNFFTGPAALFGGIEYQTPWQPLRLKVEYEGNDYQGDYAGRLKQALPINIGALYRFSDWADVNVSYQRGNTLMAGITLRTNFTTLHQQHIDAPPKAYDPQPQPSILDAQVVAEQLAELQDNAGYNAPYIQVKDSTLYVTGEQNRYRNTSEAVDRANRIIANKLPDGVDTINVTNTNMNLPLTSTITDVDNLKASLNGYPLGYEQPLKQHRTEPKTIYDADQAYYVKQEKLKLDWAPVLNQSLGGPEGFYMYQLGVSGSADYWLTPKFVASGSLFLNLLNNYDQFNFTDPPKDSYIPHVRTHIREYVNKHDLYLTDLQLSYIDRLADGWYGLLYGGYLEQMFGGVGGEVLYRPLDSVWAIGFDANYVQQRDWHNPMRFINYRVATGNLTAYWQPQFIDGILLRTSVGRYLAGDKGITVDIAKRFDSGVIAGAFATKTNVSARDYGEGAFTKGFYISIPLDLLTVRPTQARAHINWVPLTRDGGQMLGRKYHLYAVTDSRSPYY